jgi:hypothetical protein
MLTFNTIMFWMFILSYPTTESPFRLKNVPSDITFLLQIDQILRAFHENDFQHNNVLGFFNLKLNEIIPFMHQVEFYLSICVFVKCPQNLINL